MSKTEDYRADLMFPSTLGSDKVAAKNSIAVFRAELKKEKDLGYSIYLPSPTGLSVNDQATYNTIDFGIMGANTGGLFGGGIRQAFKAAGLKIKKKAGGLGGMTGEQVEKAAGTITNPNTNTTFSGNAVRSFSFTYKFIPESEAEAETVKQIIRRFKGLSYASTGNSDKENPASIILTYPPIWQVKFLKNINGAFQENRFMPKIYDCYLTTVTTNYNPNSNAFFKGGAPVVIDLSLTYQETRALTRNDIDNMENELDQEGTFNESSDNNKQIPPQKVSSSTNNTNSGGVRGFGSF